MNETGHSWYFVCTGNICRSAFAKAYLEKIFSELPRTEAKVDSGGTGVNQVLEPTVEIKQLATLNGIFLEEHRPKTVTSNALQKSDVILTATLAHRAQVLREVPTVMNRVFTIKEFAMLLNDIDVSTIQERDASKWWRTVAHRASSIRSRVNAGEHNLDIIDPFRQEHKIYEDAVVEIKEALDRVVVVEKERYRII